MTKPATALRLLPALVLGASLLTSCGKEDSTALVAEAKEKIAAGDYKTAMIQLKNAVTEDEKNADARFELGKLYLDQTDHASAEKEFRRAREAGFSADAVNPMIARTLIAQREYQRVLDELPIPADSGPDGATLQALRATAELGLGRKEDARQTAQAALQNAPGNVDVHLTLAQLALADGNAEKAMQELDQALQIDPKHRDTLLLKGDLLRATGKSSEAVALYRQVVQIDPRHTNARLALASIALATNKLDEARQEVGAALKATPGSLQAHYILALIDFREKKTEPARDNLAKVLKAAPNYLPALQLGGAIEYALGNLQTAEAHLNKVIKATPNNLYALRLLAATQLRLGRPDDAARTLAPALKSARNDAGVLVVAGEIALAKKDFAQASTYFEQAISLNPDSAAIRTELGISRLAQGDSRAIADLQAAANMEGANARADNFIILNQLKKKEFDAALTSIAALEEKQPASPQPWNYRGAAYLGKKDETNARKSFERALTLQADFFPAAANLARLDLQDNNPAAAKRRFEGILAKRPDHVQSMIAIAQLEAKAGREKEYLSLLEKAEKTDTQAFQPRALLVQYWLGKNDTGKALAYAREALNANPNSGEALDLLGKVQQATGDRTNAIGTYRRLAAMYQQSASAQTRLAEVLLQGNELAGARKAAIEALRLDPKIPEAKALLAGIEFREGKLAKALATTRELQEENPRNFVGFILEGDILLTQKQGLAAAKAYEAAWNIAQNGGLAIKLHQAYALAGQVGTGEARLNQWLDKQPNDRITRLYLAEATMKSRNFLRAASQYEILLAQVPDNLVALNNLAWLYQQTKNPKALATAERAYKLKPDSSAITDTYAWILVESGQSQKAVPLLRQALSKAPDAAEIHWHLAYALHKNGDKHRAKQELDRLLSSGLSFPQSQAAHELRQQLSN